MSASVFTLLFTHALGPLRGGQFIAMMLWQIGHEHFAHDSRTARISHLHDAINHKRPREILFLQFQMQFISQRQAKKIADERAIKCRELINRQERPQFRRISHI